MGIRIAKDKVPVVIITSKFRLEGNIHVVIGGRLLDEVNKERDFIPLTDVTVYDEEGNPIDNVEFIALNKDFITFLSPTAEPPRQKEEAP